MEAYQNFYRCLYPKSSAELLSEPVCFNSKIKIGGQFINQRNWLDKGITNIGHFLEGNGQFLSLDRLFP